MNLNRSREYFTVHRKVNPTEFTKIIVSNHRQSASIRQKFMNLFHDKLPVNIKNVELKFITDILTNTC